MCAIFSWIRTILKPRLETKDIWAAKAAVQVEHTRLSREVVRIMQLVLMLYTYGVKIVDVDSTAAPSNS